MPPARPGAGTYRLRSLRSTTQANHRSGWPASHRPAWCFVTGRRAGGPRTRRRHRPRRPRRHRPHPRYRPHSHRRCPCRSWSSATSVTSSCRTPPAPRWRLW